MNSFPRNSMMILALALLPALLHAQDTTVHSITSRHTKDKYVITIKNHKPALKQHAVFVADGSLKLGQYILGTDEDWKAAVPENCVIITIAHTGDWHMKRQRDFIPSDAGGYKNDEFGHAMNFYLFLREELFPFVNSKIQNQADRSFIGHSFSGLFSLYASLQQQKLFDRYFAISPSVWANYYELPKVEKNYADKNSSLNGKLFLYAGSLEVFNKVYASTTEYYQTLQSRKYTGLNVQFTEIKYANHFSIIKPAVDNIFKSINK
jgi:predicted alpha/beta superfamily hydrolase